MKLALTVLITALLAVSSARAEILLIGRPQQGGLVVGKTEPGATATLDGVALMVSPDGFFAFGFDRDRTGKAELKVTLAGGTSEIKEIEILPRDWSIQRVDGVAPKYVSPSPEELQRIKRDTAKKNAARVMDTKETFFAQKFIWPANGKISGVFGSQRIFNGEPRRPHYGVDVAAPTGAPIVAPADGIVRLAEPDMFFEGGLVFLDHGHGVISLMMHMSRVDVKTGQLVKQGDPIGAVGATGRATGPHLHWGMFWRKEHLDPALLISDPPVKPGDVVGR